MSRKGVCSFKIVFAAPENTTLSPHFTKPSLVCQAVGCKGQGSRVPAQAEGVRTKPSQASHGSETWQPTGECSVAAGYSWLRGAEARLQDAKITSGRFGLCSP